MSSRSAGPSRLKSESGYPGPAASAGEHTPSTRATLSPSSVNAALLCARHDFSRAGQLKQAYERLAAGGVNVAGAAQIGA